MSNPNFDFVRSPGDDEAAKAYHDALVQYFEGDEEELPLTWDEHHWELYREQEAEDRANMTWCEYMKTVGNE